MKHKWLTLLLICEAALLFVFFFSANQFPAVISSIPAFPMEPIAAALKALSMTGPFGNGLAMALLMGISLIPLLLSFRYPKEKAVLWERVTLCGLSCVLFLSLYGMANPHIFCPPIPSAGSEYFSVIKAVIGASVWSALILYAVLRLLRTFRAGDKAVLMKNLRGLLHILCILFTAFAATALAEGVLSAADASQAPMDLTLRVLRIFPAAVPYLLDIAVIMRGIDLLAIAGTDNQDGIAAAADRLCRSCCTALGVTTGITAGFYILQFILMRFLTDVSASVNIPVTSIVFVCLILLFSKLLTENKKLRDDNSLFI